MTRLSPSKEVGTDRYRQQPLPFVLLPEWTNRFRPPLDKEPGLTPPAVLVNSATVNNSELSWISHEDCLWNCFTDEL